MRKFLMILAFLFLSIGIASCTGSQKVLVIFEENGGAEIEDVEISISSTSVQLPTPTREGFTFDGWFLDAELTQPFTLASLLTQNASLTLYAKWVSDVTLYTITYEVNGGTTVSAESHAAGVTITAPTAPTKEGYTFGGWYTDALLTTAYTFTTMPASNLTLYAKWNVIIVNQTISFEENGGSVVADITAPVGSAVTPPEHPTKVGHTFAGWYTDIALTTAYTFGVMPSTALTLYAKWTVNNYTITFEENGGSVVADITQGYHTAVTAPATPTREGYTFAGWYSDIALTTAYTFTTMPASNVTLYAKWTLNNYTITFEENGGSGVMDITQGYNTAVTAPAEPLREGHTFAGWYSDIALTTAYTFTTMPASNLTLYAKWTLNNYTITFEENGGSVVADITQGYHTAVTAPATPTKSGMVFMGWYTDIALTTVYTFTTMPSVNMTLYAKWDYETYTLTFMNTEGLLPVDIKAHDPIMLPTPTKTGHTLEGWYIDAFFLTPFELTTMPEEDVTIYAKWSINQYTVSYNTSGGNTIADATATYQMDIPVPADPTKEGFIFAGWYFDNALTERLTNQPMPGANLTLYAKWVEVDELWTIADVLLYQPQHVKVQGTVVYKFPGGQPGYYITDGTGIIFVLAPSDVTVGIIYQFEADFSFFEYVPQLTNQMNRIVVAGTPDTVSYHDISISVIATADPTDLSMMGLPVIVEGVIYQEFGHYFMVEPGSSRTIAINYKSITPMNDPFIGHVGERFKVFAFVHGYDPMNDMWHIVYDPSTPASLANLTDQQKVDELLAFAVAELDGKVFYSNQKLELPATEPVYGAGLTFITMGENASYFNPSSGEFLETTTELEIILRVTVDVNDKTGYVDVTLILKTIEILTISEFGLLDDYTYGVVTGIVVFSLDAGDMKIMIIADETGAILAIETDDYVDIGTRVHVHGYKFSMMEFTLMQGMDDSILAIIETDVANPLTPINISIAQFNALDVMHTIYWGRYYEIHGTLFWDDMTYTFYLKDLTYEMPILVFDQSGYESLMPFVGFDIGLRGFGLPNFDDEPQMMFMFSGQSGDITYDYTDQEMVDLFAPLLKTYLESEIFVPGQTLMLPTEHPVLPLTVSYLVDVLDQALVSESWVISIAISEETYITVHATLTFGTATKDIVIEIHVMPLVITSIDDFLHKTDDEMYYIEAVIFYISHEDKMVILVDGTGVIMASIDDPSLAVGDRLILYGMRMEVENMVIIANDPKQIVTQVLGHGEDIPLLSTLYTVEEITNTPATDPNIFLSYVEVMGTLRKDGMNEIYYLEDLESHAVYLFTINDSDLAVLNGYVGQDIRVKGLWMHSGPIGMVVVVFLNYPGDINPRFTDAELAIYLANKLEEDHLYKILRPGATYVLPTTYGVYDVSIVYEVLGSNAGLYNLATGFISDTITEPTIIQIKATITVGTEVAIAEFDLVVEPIVTQTVADFLAGAENDEFIVRGVVVMAQYGDGPLILADETGLMFIVKPFDVNVGDEIIVQGIVTLYEGLKLMWDYETTVLLEVVSVGVDNPLTAEVMTISDLNGLDMTSTTHWGRYIEVTGYMTYMKESFFPLLRPELDSSEFIPVFPTYLFEASIFPDPEILYQYDGLRVVIKAFLFPTFDEEDPFAPDRMLMVATAADIVLDYDTDQEKIDALILLGQHKFENQVYRPGDELQLPEEFPLLDATLSWAFVGDVNAVIDPMTMIFKEVLSEQIIQVTATITIGMLTQQYTFDVTVAPYPILSFIEFMAISDYDFGKVQAIVYDIIDDYHIILQEVGSGIYLYAYYYPTLVKGDEVILFGQKSVWDGIVSIIGWDDRAAATVLNQDITTPLVETESSLYEVSHLDDHVIQDVRYYVVTGRLMQSDYDGLYYLTDGINTIILLYADFDVEDMLYAKLGGDVQVKFFIYEKTWSSLGYGWAGIVVNETDAIQDYVFTEADIVMMMKQYISQRLQVQYKDGLSYALETYHPLFIGSYAYAIDSLDEDKAAIMDNIIHFAGSSVQYEVIIYVTVTYGSTTVVDPYYVQVFPYEVQTLSFVPGEAGELPFVSGMTPVGEFVGLYVSRVERYHNWMGGDEMVVDLYFPYPEDVGAGYYNIQYYDMTTESWKYIEDYDGPIKSYWNNFSLVFGSGMTVRLITNTGLISNEASFAYTDIDTYFAGYYLDMGMWITEIMYPFVGYGLELSAVSIYTLDDVQVNGGYTLQWYRINPYTFEETAILGETNPIYITTMDDVGYFIMLEVKGDGVHAGGMMRILIEDTVKLMNPGFIANETNIGFDIGYLYEISLAELEDIIFITDQNGNPIAYTSIEETATPNVYHVNINLIGVDEIAVYIENSVMIVGQPSEYHMMEGLYSRIYEWED